MTTPQEQTGAQVEPTTTEVTAEEVATPNGTPTEQATIETSPEQQKIDKIRANIRARSAQLKAKTDKDIKDILEEVDSAKIGNLPEDPFAEIARLQEMVKAKDWAGLIKAKGTILLLANDVFPFCKDHVHLDSVATVEDLEELMVMKSRKRIKEASENGFGGGWQSFSLGDYPEEKLLYSLDYLLPLDCSDLEQMENDLGYMLQTIYRAYRKKRQLERRGMAWGS